jgi:hypothetical protein
MCVTGWWWVVVVVVVVIVVVVACVCVCMCAKMVMNTPPHTSLYSRGNAINVCCSRSLSSTNMTTGAAVYTCHAHTPHTTPHIHTHHRGTCTTASTNSNDSDRPHHVVGHEAQGVEECAAAECTAEVEHHLHDSRDVAASATSHPATPPCTRPRRRKAECGRGTCRVQMKMDL